MEATMRRLMIAVAGAICVLGQASSGSAVTHVSELSTNLDNYRVCAGDSPLDTCAYADVRSPSVYHLTNNTKGTVVYNGTTAKIRIDSIELDTRHPNYSCVSQSYTCSADNASPCTKKCKGPRGDLPYPSSCCATDADCQAVACNGGPQDDRACSTANDCLKLDDSRHWNVVLRGNENAYTCPSGPPCQFQLHGDADGTGCMIACDFTLDVAGSPTIGSVNNNSVSCQMSGDCWYTPNFHHVEIVDPDGNVVAIPKVGNVTIYENFLSSDDPAKFGDACRTQNPPPADCP
jgi:hypothetical protein